MLQRKAGHKNNIMGLKEQLTKLDNLIKEGNNNSAFMFHIEALYTNYPENKEEITEYAENLLRKETQRIDEAIENISLKVQIGEDIRILPLAYIAENYFHKTRNWLYQKINGNQKNGKAAKFTKEEKELFQFALKDISEKISSIQIS